MTNKEIKDLLCRYDDGMATGNEVISAFLAINETEGARINAVNAAIISERDRLLEPLTEKVYSLLEMIANSK